MQGEDFWLGEGGGGLKTFPTRENQAYNNVWSHFAQQIMNYQPLSNHFILL